MATFGFEVLKNSFLVFVNTKGEKKERKDKWGQERDFPTFS